MIGHMVSIKSCIMNLWLICEFFCSILCTGHSQQDMYVSCPPNLLVHMSAGRIKVHTFQFWVLLKFEWSTDHNHYKELPTFKMQHSKWNHSTLPNVSLAVNSSRKNLHRFFFLRENVSCMYFTKETRHHKTNPDELRNTWASRGEGQEAASLPRTKETTQQKMWDPWRQHALWWEEVRPYTIPAPSQSATTELTSY
jgi:hypothetical protein